MPPVLIAVYAATQILQAALEALKIQNSITEEQLNAEWERVTKDALGALALWEHPTSTSN